MPTEVKKFDNFGVSGKALKKIAMESQGSGKWRNHGNPVSSQSRQKVSLFDFSSSCFNFCSFKSSSAEKNARILSRKSDEHFQPCVENLKKSTFPCSRDISDSEQVVKEKQGTWWEGRGVGESPEAPISAAEKSRFERLQLQPCHFRKPESPSLSSAPICQRNAPSPLPHPQRHLFLSLVWNRLF